MLQTATNATNAALATSRQIQTQQNAICALAILMRTSLERRIVPSVRLIHSGKQLNLARVDWPTAPWSVSAFQVLIYTTHG